MEGCAAHGKRDTAEGSIPDNNATQAVCMPFHEGVGPAYICTRCTAAACIASGGHCASVWQGQWMDSSTAAHDKVEACGVQDYAAHILLGNTGGVYPCNAMDGAST